MLKTKRTIVVSCLAICIGGFALAFMPCGENKLEESFYADNVAALSGDESDPDVVKCYCKSRLWGSNVCSANADGAYCGGNPCANHDGNCR